MALTTWTSKSITNLPAEAAVVRKTVAALKAAGNPVVKVNDGEETIPVNGLHDVLNAVFAVDMATLYTADGNWVLIILGNEWDALSDHSLDLEDVLAPVIDWAGDHE